MFRYKLNTYTALWEIQLLRWGFFWVTLRNVEFDTLEAAVAGAGASGISIHYREQPPFNHKPGVPIHDTHDNNVLEKSE